MITSRRGAVVGHEVAVHDRVLLRELVCPRALVFELSPQLLRVEALVKHDGGERQPGDTTHLKTARVRNAHGAA